MRYTSSDVRMHAAINHSIKKFNRIVNNNASYKISIMIF